MEMKNIASTSLFVGCLKEAATKCQKMEQSKLQHHRDQAIITYLSLLLILMIQIISFQIMRRTHGCCTKYSMRSRPDGNKGYYHLKSWVIEGSNTGNDDDWKTLDKKNSIGLLDGRSASQTFEIPSHLGQNEYFKCLRVRITGPNSYGENYYNLISSALEYFGFITE
ncbi:hypothetical protein M9Y10_018534 [Tritrichomonas musculus]|uniref:SUN domain-containing protein n=1 Tax=Tritrichomonas musculus TaxID=1915356 RepID=A0ABR2HMX3_9EUKA